MGKYGADTARSGIYKITNEVNGKIYVGQSQNVFKRKMQHFSELRANAHENHCLQSDWNKNHGRHFTWEVIEYCPIEELNEREQYWITALNSLEPHGYNMGWVPYKRRTQKKSAYKRKHYRSK